MRKRIFAMLVALIMAISLFPVTALAVYVDPPVASTSYVKTDPDSAVQIKKSVSEVNNDGTYTLSMEAYVTGQVVTTNPEPLDIVLVLDVSGSMADDISIVTEENVTYSPVKDRAPIRFFWFEFKTNTNSYVYSDWEKGGEYWYSEDGETLYPVTKIERKERKESGDLPLGLGDTTYVHYEYTYTVDGEDKVYATQEYKSEILSGILGNDADNEVVQRIYYKTVETEIQTVSKMKALQNAVNSFITKTAEKNAAITDDDAKHRISIVKFAGDSTNDVGNDTYEEGWYRYNYSQIVKKLTTVDSDGVAELTDAVNALQAAGATSADYGMAHAKTVLNKRPEGEKTRKQVVIFFTDGEPNHGNGFVNSVANDAIGEAKNLKDAGATIYTIGVFAGADPNDGTKNVNKFMHAVSSNYPTAESLNNMGDRTPGSDYYKTANSEAALTKIFGDIADEMVPDVEAGSNSVLTDTVSGYFTAPEEATGVTVKVYQASGNGEALGWTEDETFDTTDIKVTVSGQNISVTGFDYSANAVVKMGDSWQGKKLVISFDIAPDAAATWRAGTHPYPTNVAGENEANNAGLSYGSKKTALTESPTVLITAYTVAYLYGDTAPEGAPDLPAGGVYLPGTNVTVAPAPNLDGYTFSGWRTTNAHVSVSSGMFTMPNNNVILTGSWTFTETEPEAPTDLSNILTGNFVTVQCISKNAHDKKSLSYGLLEGGYRIGGVEGDAANGYTCKVTFDANTYQAKYNDDTESKHILAPAGQTGSITLLYAPNADGTAWTWEVDSGSKVPVTFTVVCETPEEDPEKPTDEDLSNILRGSFVTVECISTNDHSSKSLSYGLLLGGYTIGEVKDNAEDGYTCEVTFYADVYQAKYNDDTTSKHELYPQEQQPVSIVLTWNSEKWTAPDGYAVHFTVTCDGDSSYYTVTYADGVDGVVVFADQTYYVRAGEKTPAFVGTPTRPGYRFVGWYPAVTETVTETVTYTAQWRRSYHPTTPAEAKPTLNKADHYAYVVGYPDGTVQPQGAITRAEVATIFFRQIGRAHV